MGQPSQRDGQNGRRLDKKRSITIKGRGLITRVLILGGNWNNGSNAGLWCANGNNDSSNVNSNIGSRLAKIHRTEAEALRGFGQIQNIRGLRPNRKVKHQNGAAVSRDRKWPHQYFKGVKCQKPITIFLVK
jgi:hypothetical protein